MASISSSPWSLLRLSLPWDLPPTISCSEDLWNWNYSSYKGHIPSFQTWLFFGKMTSTILSSNGQCPFTSNPVHTSLLFSSKHLNWIISFFLRISGSSHFRYLRHFFAGDARSGVVCQHQIITVIIVFNTKMIILITISTITSYNYLHHHQARADPIDGSPRDYVCPRSPLRLLLDDGKESFFDGEHVLNMVLQGEHLSTLYPSIVVYPLLVGPGGVRQGEGGEQDFHRQRASGTKTREHSVDCRNDLPIQRKVVLFRSEWHSSEFCLFSFPGHCRSLGPLVGPLGWSQLTIRA